MRTPRLLPEGAAERVTALLKEAKSQAAYQRIQCVWLRAALSLGASQMAAALGGQVGSVRQVHSDSHIGVCLRGRQPAGGHAGHAGTVRRSCRGEERILGRGLTTNPGRVDPAGARWSRWQKKHRAKRLNVPAPRRLLFLPPGRPPLNPVEQVWDQGREKWLANRVVACREAVEDQLVTALATLEADAPRVTSLTGFAWIKSIPLNAH
jgi:transposase